MKHLFLSYYINEKTPIYGGEQSISIKNKSSILKGDSSNSKILHFPNHTGTHIDFPNHFSENGKTINHYKPSFWFFKNVTIINYNAVEDEIIDDKIINSTIPFETEFLIINTEFYKKRESKLYWNNNPGLSPKLAAKLKEHCPNLRVVGFDFISLTSYQNRMLGRKAHTEFLINNDILLIEDMDLRFISNKKIKSITALPLLFDNLDGAPITICAQYE